MCEIVEKMIRLTFEQSVTQKNNNKTKAESSPS